jgi:poly-gamma-glutamate capsule biosynthesis protein CapA/YwtB (metallophosphatase superfamily)
MQWRLPVAVGAGLFTVLLAGFCSPDGGVEPDQSAGDVRDSAPPQPVTSSTTLPPRSFTLVATGDVLLHPTLWDQAGADAAAAGRAGLDFGPMLAALRPLVSGADVAICHLETPVAPQGGPYSGYPSFSVPPEITRALSATGYDACTTASNHTYDRGAEGVDRTLDALDVAGMDHAGSARTPEEAAATTLLELRDGVDVALVSYTFGFNGIPAPDGETWRSNLIDEARILTDAGIARQRGAEVVVVALHWGDEYRHETNGQQDDLGPRLIRSPDIDLLLGHHAHVVQPVEPIDGEWVVYGMGNLVSDHASQSPERQEGLLVRFAFTETPSGWRTTAAEFTPLLTDDRGPIRVLDVRRSLADPATDPGVRGPLQAADDRTTAIVDQRGATRAGLQPIGT